MPQADDSIVSKTRTKINLAKGDIAGLHFRGSGGRRGSAMAPFERATVVSYRLTIVTIELSLTIRPQFAVECLRHSNQQRGGSLWDKI